MQNVESGLNAKVMEREIGKNIVKSVRQLRIKEKLINIIEKKEGQHRGKKK